MKQVLAEWALKRPWGTLSRRGGGLLYMMLEWWRGAVSILLGAMNDLVWNCIG